MHAGNNPAAPRPAGHPACPLLRSDRGRSPPPPPAGVDLVIAFNQSASEPCHLAGACEAAYARWRALVLEALCAAPWDEVGAAAP